MKQRLKLAQALVHDPPALLLDEPTSGMDPAGREGMLDLLLTLGKEHKKAILLSTHLLGDIDKVCDAVVILHQGRILCQGPVQQLCRRRHDRYRLQIQGEPNAFLDELRLEGVQILHDNGRGDFRVQVPANWTTQAFFKFAHLHNVAVRGLQADDEDLEELFHRVIAENPSSTEPRGARGES
jgi:ABC-2 type transport system ATP-binding protein